MTVPVTSRDLDELVWETVITSVRNGNPSPLKTAKELKVLHNQLFSESHLLDRCAELEEHYARERKAHEAYKRLSKQYLKEEME